MRSSRPRRLNSEAGFVVTGANVRVVSVSLPEEMVQAVDRIAGEGAFSGRSELVRAALTPFLGAKEEEQERTGPATATLTLCYDEAVGEMVNRQRHEHEGPITTMVHGHISEHGCLEILVLEGDAQEIRALAEEFQGRRGIHRVELVWVS